MHGLVKAIRININAALEGYTLYFIHVLLIILVIMVHIKHKWNSIKNPRVDSREHVQL